MSSYEYTYISTGAAPRQLPAQSKDEIALASEEAELLTKGLQACLPLLHLQFALSQILSLHLQLMRTNVLLPLLVAQCYSFGGLLHPHI